MSAPKSLKDFKKNNNNNNQNTILTSGKMKQEQNALNMGVNTPSMNGFMENSYQDNFHNQQDFAQQSEFPQSLKPNFEHTYNQTNISDISNDNVAFGRMSEMEMPIQGMVNNAPQQQVVQNVTMQPMMNTTNVMEETKKTMREEYQTQPYQNVQTTHVMEKKATNNKSIVSHMQAIEIEIDGLVNNTEAFLNNTKSLKMQILRAKDRNELENIMTKVHETLKDIPDSFIDAETRRKIRLCFSYLQKTKKELLDKQEEIKKTQEDLENLVAIDDIDELENVILEIPASPTTDNVYDIRTFEITLVNQLPTIKEEMLREKMLAAYNS